MRTVVRSVILFFARTFGTEIKDADSGDSLGRAFVIPWRGKIHFIGLQRALRPVFQSQQRLTYWKQELIFTTHPPPDFENLRGGEENAESRDA